MNALDLDGIEPSATIEVGDRAKELAAAGHDVVNLGNGSPDFDTPEHVREAAKDALDAGETQLSLTKGVPELREAIAEKLAADNGIDADPENVIVAPGSKYSLFETLAAIVDPGDEVALLDPSWVSYEALVGLVGGRVRRVTLDPEAGFSPGSVDLAAELEGVDAVIVNNPSNPAGAVWDDDELRELRDAAVDGDFWVISDEIYDRLVHEGEHRSLATLDGMAGRTITTNGFSKTYAMSGWRLGYLAGPDEVVDRAARMQSQTVSSPTNFAQHGAIAALTGPQDAVESMRRTYDERLDVAMNALAEAGIDMPRPDAAYYVFVPVEADDDVALCGRILEEEHVATTPGSAFGVPGYVRIACTADADRVAEGMHRIVPYLR